MTKSAAALALDRTKLAGTGKPETQIIRKAELLELASLEQAYSDACKEQADLERRTKAARLALATKVLGVETEEQLKRLDPPTLEELMAVREGKGWWKLERGAPPFLFQKTNEGRYPSWKTEFIAEEGEAKAQMVMAETPRTYSYRIDVVI